MDNLKKSQDLCNFKDNYYGDRVCNICNFSNNYYGDRICSKDFEEKK